MFGEILMEVIPDSFLAATLVQKPKHRNLSQIFQYSRLPVWIDLISIDTDDNIKAKKVAVMDLVYSNAAAVLVLLEPEDAIRIMKATEVCKKWYNACLGNDTQENIKEMI